MTEEQEEVFTEYEEKIQKNIEWSAKYLTSIMRLPGIVKPKRYDVEITPYIPGSGKYGFYRNLTFDGKIKMKFAVTRRTSEVVLNAHRLVIDPDTIILEDAQHRKYDVTALGVTKDYENGILTIPVAGALFPDVEYSLSISYSGFIFDKPHRGILSNYNFYEFNGKQGWIFSTNFEGGPGSRSLMICCDEPSYKAVFNSSYLVAICVGQFASLSTVSETGVLVRAYSWTGMEQYADFSLKWFGDLVTMDWWSSTFLNEGLAEYWAHIAASHVLPEQKDYFLVRKTLLFEGYSRFATTATSLWNDCGSNSSAPLISDDGGLFAPTMYLKVRRAFTRLEVTDRVMFQKSFPILKVSVDSDYRISYRQESCINGSATWYIPIFSANRTNEGSKQFQNSTGSMGNTVLLRHGRYLFLSRDWTMFEAIREDYSWRQFLDVFGSVDWADKPIPWIVGLQFMEKLYRSFRFTDDFQRISESMRKIGYLKGGRSAVPTY
ncbi:hypothetical protein ANCCEY_03546 [Ancylostoma ceylanicum]|uniref:Uncharacterized protein n=1 Tax=Ancylostoma ceylanicum TaxID=53326 RepID=A0A0D6M1P4_9BILA|nr:hypothetical protein ANCCEY_03546 [Ancylostoma ceylanicum]